MLSGMDEPEHPQITAKRETAREHGYQAGVEGKARSPYSVWIWAGMTKEWLEGYDEGESERADEP